MNELLIIKNYSYSEVNIRSFVSKKLTQLFLIFFLFKSKNLYVAEAERVSTTRILTLDSDRINNSTESWVYDEKKRNIENKIAIILGYNYKEIRFKEKS